MASFFNILRRLVHGSPVHSARSSESSGIWTKKWVGNRMKLHKFYERQWKQMEAKIDAALNRVEIAEADRANAEKARVVAEKERVIAEQNRLSAELERSISGEKRKEEDEKHGGL